MRRVVVESPYAGEVRRNTAYARMCLMDALSRGEAPFASHILYTQPGVLDDDDTEERAIGITAGLTWGSMADATVVYTDFGISRGMQVGITNAESQRRPVEYRRLPPSKLAALHDQLDSLGKETRAELHAMWNEHRARVLQHEFSGLRLTWWQTAVLFTTVWVVNVVASIRGRPTFHEYALFRTFYFHLGKCRLP